MATELFKRTNDKDVFDRIIERDDPPATEDTHVGKIADLLQRHRIKRVPILRDGKVVGIVSRADLIHALAKMPQAMTDTD